MSDTKLWIRSQPIYLHKIYQRDRNTQCQINALLCTYLLFAWTCIGLSFLRNGGILLGFLWPVVWCFRSSNLRVHEYILIPFIHNTCYGENVGELMSHVQFDQILVEAFHFEFCDKEHICIKVNKYTIETGRIGFLK